MIAPKTVPDNMPPIVHIVDLDRVVPQPLPEAAEQRARRFVQHESALRFRQRRTAILSLVQAEGVGALQWCCPICQGRDHGRPAATEASISSSSHGSCLVVAIDRQRRAIGVDVTAQHAPADAEGIARMLFTPVELQQRDAAGWSVGDEFARIWSAKEALGKAHGTGLAVDDSAACGGRLDSLHHAGSLIALAGLPAGLVGSLAVLE